MKHALTGREQAVMDRLEDMVIAHALLTKHPDAASQWLMDRMNEVKADLEHFREAKNER